MKETAKAFSAEAMKFEEVGSWLELRNRKKRNRTVREAEADMLGE